MLLIGAFAGLLVRTYSAKQDLWGAFESVSLTLLFSWFAIGISVWLIQRDSLVWLSLGWRLPFLKRFYTTYKLAFEQTFYRLLTWQIASGVAPDSALKNMRPLLNANSYQNSANSAARMLDRGVNLENCLTEHGFVLTQPMKRVMQTSLEAGVWEKAVLHHLDWQQQVLSQKADNFFKWLPKFYYLLALVAITRYMFV